ncbi:hypothetical protein CBL_13524 [Carabus blaptoides fortunei]
MSENSVNRSVEEDTANISVKSEIFDEYDERAQLKTEIHKMQQKIDRLRRKMTDRISKVHVSFKEVMAKMHVDNTVPCTGKRMRHCLTVNLMFYEMIMKIHVTRHNSQIILFLTVPDKKTYALQFIKLEDQDLYDLKRSCLPYSVNIIEEMQKAKSFTINQMIDYCYYIRKNIYAYHMRVDQVQQFQTLVKNEKFYVDHDLGYTQVEFVFSVTERYDESIDYRIKAIFHYNLLNIRPKKIITKAVDNDLDKAKQMKVQKCLLQCKQKSLPELYYRFFATQSPYTIL